MPLSIRNPYAEKLAKEIAFMTGENITQTIIYALENQLERFRYRDTVQEIMNISRRCSSILDKDTRSPNEIIGYNKSACRAEYR